MRVSPRPDIGSGGPLELLERYPVTFGVLAANLILFGFTVSKAGGLDISSVLIAHLGGNVHQLVLSQPWRLLTSAFLHYGLLHIVGNGLALYFVGRVLEIHYGSHRLWVLYVIFAVTSGLGSASWNALVATGKLPFGSVGISAGASGALFGLIFMGFVYARAHRHRLGSVADWLRTWIFVGVVITFLMPRVDIAGHVTGALAGAIAGTLVQPVPGEDPHPAWRPVSIALAVLGLLCVGAAVLNLRQQTLG